MQTNCLTEIFVERALERAKELDDILRETGKVVGPLHGLPVSLKGALETLLVLHHSEIMHRPIHNEGLRNGHGYTPLQFVPPQI